MEKLNQKKMVTLLASVGLMAGMAVATQGFAAGHDRTYTSDASKSMVMNGSGECWLTAGGTAGPKEECGDEMPKPMEAEPVAMAPADSDGDGVIDPQDKCPGTRAGAKVDQWGCEIMESVVIDLVEGEFAFDSAELTPAMKAELDNVATQINNSPGGETLLITGHTDSTGPADYNQGLSEQRAQAAADHLSSRGVAADRISVTGKGETMPVADNGTREGRAKNRRIEVETN